VLNKVLKKSTTKNLLVDRMKARCDRPLQRLMSVTMNTYQPKIITETRRKIEDLCREGHLPA
jgi:hypothetical protein